ncbi:MAG: bifunctional glutamate N-acetyltransferase/amino-acid acetyltransferase ArgJ [Deltaproteobacteria bacterium]|nr:bifunctional glutamate N-acetyltransferase/amino-acid acetyltransferase ArgJ [Deltaproteobacteria bacterium]
MPSTVKGFRFAQVEASLRYKGRPDLALIVADRPAATAAVFTQNAVTAAPVLLCREHLKKAPKSRAVIINAGRANACTGKPGLADARQTARALARTIACRPEEVLTASTGIIGQRIGVEKLVENVPPLVHALQPGSIEPLAKAIMTTDTRPKFAEAGFQSGRTAVTVQGIAKGAGMIAPNMATLLAFAVTDAVVPQTALRQAFGIATRDSFNAITIDGDTSTNDTAILMASGAAGAENLAPGSAGFRKFAGALAEVMTALARMVVSDGEGATRLIRVAVTGARSEPEARRAAFTIANSPLCKTAFAGGDPNWGRLIAAAGRAGVKLNGEKFSVTIGGVPVVKRGVLPSIETDRAAAAVMKGSEFDVVVDLASGRAKASVYTCDFTEGYIRINADYRS